MNKVYAPDDPRYFKDFKYQKFDIYDTILTDPITRNDLENEMIYTKEFNNVLA